MKKIIKIESTDKITNASIFKIDDKYYRIFSLPYTESKGVFIDNKSELVVETNIKLNEKEIKFGNEFISNTHEIKNQHNVFIVESVEDNIENKEDAIIINKHLCVDYDNVYELLNKLDLVKIFLGQKYIQLSKSDNDIFNYFQITWSLFIYNNIPYWSPIDLEYINDLNII